MCELAGQKICSWPQVTLLKAYGRVNLWQCKDRQWENILGGLDLLLSLGPKSHEQIHSKNIK